ncbi:hypothetical protein TNCV_2819461 [Trichonephila clavipes]|nr:hypothetical protein TNCV_2819461 [Trichonephila clavipes]
MWLPFALAALVRCTRCTPAGIGPARYVKQPVVNKGLRTVERTETTCNEESERNCKSNLTQSSNIARAKKVARFNETFPQAELRRLEQAESEAAHRAAETPEQSQARRRRHAEYLASQRAAETTEQSEARRLQHATYMASQRDTETIEAAESRKRAVAERAQQRRLIFTKTRGGRVLCYLLRCSSPPGGTIASRLLHSSINCQVANLTLSPTFHYVSIESPL